MPEWMEFPAALLTFAIGLRLSAFFSGMETGFYRLSLPRLGIDAQSGDVEAARMLWYAHRPSYFVATTLVGNNIANYLATVAITNGTVVLFGPGSETTEVAATLVISPVIFLFGELLPKNVYYRAPLARMQRQIKWFHRFYLAALPASWPLVLLTRWVEKLSPTRTRTQEMLPGRGRFMQMISHGHREGLLTQTQSAMAAGVLSTATQRAIDSMIPGRRVLGLAESATREELQAYARRYGTSIVSLHPDDDETAVQWTSYVRVGDLAVESESPAKVRRQMPAIPANATKLEALATLHEHSAAFGAMVEEDGNVLGILSQRGLIEQLFRSLPRMEALGIEA
jgi:CBS domain containing-hemolysin-like protein